MPIEIHLSPTHWVTSFGKLLKMLAEDLAAQGIASVRFDKRGIGENTALIKKNRI